MSVRRSAMMRRFEELMSHLQLQLPLKRFFPPFLIFQKGGPVREDKTLHFRQGERELRFTVFAGDGDILFIGIEYGFHDIQAQADPVFFCP